MQLEPYEIEFINDCRKALKQSAEYAKTLEEESQEAFWDSMKTRIYWYASAICDKYRDSIKNA